MASVSPLSKLVIGLRVWGPKLTRFLDLPTIGNLDVLNKQTRALNFFVAQVDLLTLMFYEMMKRVLERDLPGLTKGWEDDEFLSPDTEEDEGKDQEGEEEARAVEDRQLNAVLHGLCRAFGESALLSEAGGSSKVDIPLRVAEELTKRVWCGDVGAVLTLAKLLGSRTKYVRTSKENYTDVQSHWSDAGRSADICEETHTRDVEESDEQHRPSYSGDVGLMTLSASRDPPWLIDLQAQLGRALIFFVDHGIAGESMTSGAIPVFCPFRHTLGFAHSASAISARFRALHSEAYLYDPDGEKRAILSREHRLLRGPGCGRPLDVEAVFAAVLSLLPPPLHLAQRFTNADAVLGWRPKCIMWDMGALLYFAGNGITEPLQQIPAQQLLEADGLDAATHVMCIRKLWREFWENEESSVKTWFTEIVDDL